MIELTKRDIERVARSRFLRKNEKKYFGGMFGWIALVLGGMLALDHFHPYEGIDPWAVAVGVVMLGVVVVWLFYWQRRENREVAAFVRQVEDDLVFKYTGEEKKGLVGKSG